MSSATFTRLLYGVLVVLAVLNVSPLPCPKPARRGFYAFFLFAGVVTVWYAGLLAAR